MAPWVAMTLLAIASAASSIAGPKTCSEVLNENESCEESDDFIALQSQSSRVLAAEIPEHGDGSTRGSNSGNVLHSASFGCLCTGGNVFAGKKVLPDFGPKTCSEVLNENEFCDGSKCSSCAALKSAIGDAANDCCVAAPAPVKDPPSFDCMCTGGSVYAGGKTLAHFDSKTCDVVLQGLYDQEAFCSDSDGGKKKCTSCSALKSVVQEQADVCCVVAPSPPVVPPVPKHGDGSTGGSNSRNGATTDIIVLGDSWGEGAGLKELAVACPEKTMVNRAVGGSTAHSWSGLAPDSLGCTGAGAIQGKTDCSAASAFNASFGKDYKYAWLSVGGNDFLGKSCKPDMKAVAKAVEDTIKKVKAAAPKDMKILMTGYGTPPVNVGPDCKAGSVAPLQAVIKATAEANGVTFVDVIGRFGGSESTYSDKKWYADNIHLNAAGYMRFFQTTEISAFFGCDASARP